MFLSSLSCSPEKQDVLLKDHLIQDILYSLLQHEALCAIITSLGFCHLTPNYETINN